jgi:hypothetical protein
MTLYSSAFASPSRLRLTNKQCSIEWSGAACKKFQHAAGKYAGIETLRTVHSLSFNKWTLRAAAAVDALAKLNWLCTKLQCAPSIELSYSAAASSSIAVLAWLKHRGVVFIVETAVHAARNNQMPALRYLRTEGCPWDVKVCREAAANGSCAALRWMREHECHWDASKILSTAASSGSIELVEWVHQQPGVLASSDVLAAATQHGHTALCVHLLQHQHFQLLNVSACLGAVKGGHLDTLRSLRTLGCPWIADDVRRNAAQKGSVAVLQYIQQQGLLATAAHLTDVLRIAGAYSKLEAVQWLRTQGAQRPDTLRYNSKCWNGDTLAWARQHGCPAAHARG